MADSYPELELPEFLDRRKNGWKTGHPATRTPPPPPKEMPLPPSNEDLI